MKKVRESNFELLRCILMFMVLLVHYNVGSMGNAFSYVIPGTMNYYLIYFVESLAIIGTNGFVLLTGYFSWKNTKMSLRKPIGLLLYGIAYNVLFYLLNVVFLKNPFSIWTLIVKCLPNNWYIMFYVVLMILTPYINILVRKLEKKSMLLLIAVLLIVFSLWPTMLDIANLRFGIDTTGMYTIAISGSGDGYTIVNFVLLYLIGAIISKFNLLRYPAGFDILGYGLCTCLIFIQQLKLAAGWSYANPLVIVSCVCFFNIFRKMKLQSKIVNMLSKASFGVFLIHTQYFVCNYLWSYFNIQEVCSAGAGILIMNMLLCCGITYAACSLFDILCRFLVLPVSRWLDTLKIWDKCIIKVDEI